MSPKILIYLSIISLIISCSEKPNKEQKYHEPTIEIKEVESETIKNLEQFVDGKILSVIDTTNFNKELLVDFYRKNTLDLGLPSFKLEKIDSIRVNEKTYYASSILSKQQGRNSSATAYRLLLTDDKKDVLYDSKFFDPECEVFGYYSDSLTTDSLFNSEQIVFKVKAYKHPCCGASEEKIIKNYYFDSKDNSQTFEYTSKYEYMDNDDCGDTIKLARKIITKLEKFDQDFVQLRNHYYSNENLDSIKSENLMWDLK
jgi:hypothetical protein